MALLGAVAVFWKPKIPGARGALGAVAVFWKPKIPGARGALGAVAVSQASLGAGRMKTATAPRAPGSHAKGDLWVVVFTRNFRGDSTDCARMNDKTGAASFEPEQRLDRLARVVIESALEVHRILGPGFLESVYEEALAIELTGRSIPFERQVPVSVKYKGHCVGEGRVDLLVGGELIVELKSVEVLAAVHVAQVISYLKALQHPLGLLITFNVQLLRTGVRRVVLSSL